MIKIKIKRVYDPDKASDGFRILVDKLWPRGLNKEKLVYDLWAKEVAPSNGLRQWFHQDIDAHWPVFRSNYMHELDENPVIYTFLNILKTKKAVTLLYASKNENENHAVVLKDFLHSKLNSMG